MADTLKFSLVSPERELFSGEVAQVDLPGTEGRMGILPGHAPLMAALSVGLIDVMDGDVDHQYFIRGGFADVTPAGLTVLAEQATHLADLDATKMKSHIDETESKLLEAEGEARLALSRDLEGMKEILEKSFA